MCWYMDVQRCDGCTDGWTDGRTGERKGGKMDLMEGWVGV